MDAITSGNSIVTIQRLRNLRPGQSMICYRGDFDLDLSNKETPKYSALLRQVREAMHARPDHGAASNGRPSNHHPTKKTQKIVTFKRYTATGI
jgi:hypothetical protein